MQVAQMKTGPHRRRLVAGTRPATTLPPSQAIVTYLLF